MEQLKRGARCTPETINRLVGIADSEDVALFCGKRSEELDLREVRVLELVYQNEARGGLLFPQ